MPYKDENSKWMPYPPYIAVKNKKFQLIDARNGLYRHGGEAFYYTDLLQAAAHKEKSKNDHVSEFWASFYQAISNAGGSVDRWGPDSTLAEVVDTLAQNDIRFCYKGKK